MLKIISKEKKKGKLNKKDEDDKEDKPVEWDTYKKIASNLGGLKLAIPFLTAI